MRSRLTLSLLLTMSLAAACGPSAPRTQDPAATGGPAAEPVNGTITRQLVTQGAVLLDVRTRGEYGVRHIGGARNIPVDELENRLDEVGDRRRPVVVYCMSGHRSAQAAAMLTEAGFTNVYDLGSMFSY